MCGINFRKGVGLPAVAVAVLVVTTLVLGALDTLISARDYVEAVQASQKAQCLAATSEELADALFLAHGEFGLRVSDTQRVACYLSGAVGPDPHPPAAPWPVVLPALRRLLPDAGPADSLWRSLRAACSAQAMGEPSRAAATAFLPLIAQALQTSFDRLRDAVRSCSLADGGALALADVDRLAGIMAAVRAAVPPQSPPGYAWDSSALENATRVGADIQAEIAVGVARTSLNVAAAQLLLRLDDAPAGAFAVSDRAVSQSRAIIQFIGQLSSGKAMFLGFQERILSGAPTDLLYVKLMTIAVQGHLHMLHFQLNEFTVASMHLERSIFLPRAQALLADIRAQQLALSMPMSAEAFAAALNLSPTRFSEDAVHDQLLLRQELQELHAALRSRASQRQREARVSMMAAVFGALLGLLALGGALHAWRSVALAAKLRLAKGEAARRRELSRTLMHEVRQPLSSLQVGLDLLGGSIADCAVQSAAAHAATLATLAAACPVGGSAATSDVAVAAAAGERKAAALAEAADIVGVMQEAVARLSRLTTDSLDLERMESATLPLSLAPRSLLAEVEHAVKEARLCALPKRINLVLDARCDEDIVTRLSQAHNKVKNAGLSVTVGPPKDSGLLPLPVVAAASYASAASASVESVSATAALLHDPVPRTPSAEPPGSSAVLHAPPHTSIAIPLAAGDALSSRGSNQAHLALSKTSLRDSAREPAVTELPAGLLLMLDSDRLRQVLLNLITNAVRHAPQGTDVTIAVRVSHAASAGKAAPTDTTPSSGAKSKSCWHGYACVSGSRSNASVHPIAVGTGSAEAPASGGSLPVVMSISISDAGAGIPPEKQALLFQPFSQLHDSSRDGQGAAGSGLGLAVSRSLVRLMGGDVSVLSAPPQGTTFTVRFETFAVALQPAAGLQVTACQDPPPPMRATRVAMLSHAPAAGASAVNARIGQTAAAPALGGPTGSGATFALAVDADSASCAVLPLAAPPPLQSTSSHSGSTSPSPASSPSAQAPLAGRDLRLLVVDDSVPNSLLLAKLLRALGAAAVDCVGDGAAAVDAVTAKAAAGEPYHAILLDRHMPIMDGETCARTLRGPTVGYTGAIIAVSADSDESFLAAGADALVHKPVTRAAMVAALSSRLA